MIGFSISTARSWGRISSLPQGVASVGIGNARHYAPQRPTHGIALRGIGYVPPVVNVVYKAIGRPFGITNVRKFAEREFDGVFGITRQKHYAGIDHSPKG